MNFHVFGSGAAHKVRTLGNGRFFPTPHPCVRRLWSTLSSPVSKPSMTYKLSKTQKTRMRCWCTENTRAARNALKLNAIYSRVAPNIVRAVRHIHAGNSRSAAPYPLPRAYAPTDPVRVPYAFTDADLHLLHE